MIPAIHEQKEYLITGPNSPLRPAGHKLQYWSVLDTAKMKKKKTGHENKGVLELKTSYLRWTVEARNWLLISPILLSLNARAEAVEAAVVDGSTDDLEEDMFVVIWYLTDERRGERCSLGMENRHKTKKLRVYLGKRTADYSTGAHSLADDLVRGSIIEKSARVAKSEAY